MTEKVLVCLPFDNKSPRIANGFRDFLICPVRFLLSRQVFDLVDDVLILTLGLEIETETADGADDATYASIP